MLIYFIRHGDPDYAHDSLTEKGKAQALAVSKRLSGTGIERIFVSPNGRARLTAEPTAKLLGIEPEVEDWMSEDVAWEKFSCDDGKGQRCFSHLQPGEILKSADSMSRMGGDWYHAECFRGIDIAGNMKFVEEKSDDFMHRLGYDRDGAIYKINYKNEQRVAIFGHQGNGKVWLSHLLAVPLPVFGGSFDMTHTGVTVIELKNNDSGFTSPQCLCLSDMSHIYAEGLDMEYQNRIKI